RHVDAENLAQRLLDLRCARKLSLFAVGAVEAQAIVEQRVTSLRGRSRHHQQMDELRLWAIGEEIVGDLVVGRRVILEAEAINWSPFRPDQGFEDEILTRAIEPESLVRRFLLNAFLQQ